MMQHVDHDKVGTTTYTWTVGGWKDDDPYTIAFGESGDLPRAKLAAEAAGTAEAVDFAIRRGTYEWDPDGDETVDGQNVRWVEWNEDADWWCCGYPSDQGVEWEPEAS